MATIKLSEIKIQESFLQTRPKESKMQYYRDFYEMTGKQAKPIVINKNNVLLDGYIQYLILKENNEREASVIVWRTIAIKKPPKHITTPTTYVYGTHLGGMTNKQYTWRVPNSWNSGEDCLQVGDVISCNTKCGCKKVVVRKIETLAECPVGFKVRKVCRKTINRNGELVKLW